MYFPRLFGLGQAVSCNILHTQSMSPGLAMRRLPMADARSGRSPAINSDANNETVPGYQNPLLIRPDRPLPASVAIIGAGTIGPDLAYYLKSAIPGLELVLIDIAQGALDRATQRIEGYVDKGLKRGKLTAQQAAGVRENLSTSLDYSAMADCDWVLEAATENLELKRNIFSEVESIVGREALITSNTSSLPAARLFSHLQHPERATVTHFFAPAFRNPIVEVAFPDFERLSPFRIRRHYVTGTVNETAGIEAVVDNFRHRHEVTVIFCARGIAEQ